MARGIQRKSPFWQRLDQVLLYSAPLLVTFMLCCTMILPMGLPLSAAIMPDLFLIAVFYWSLYQPSCFSLLGVFFMGLFLDVFNGEYLGTNALLGVVTYGVIYQQRNFLVPLSFNLIWAVFAAMILVISLLSLLIYTAYDGDLPGLFPLMIKGMITILLYPIFSRVFSPLDQAISEVSE